MVIDNRSFGTHDGTFHADDVMAAALLSHFNLIDIDKITRTRNINLLESREFICDVGGIYDPDKKRFDHHQNDYTGSLSSAGMVLVYLLDSNIIEIALYTYLNDLVIKGVDDIDNGLVNPVKGHCNFSSIISNFLLEYLVFLVCLQRGCEIT